MSSALLKKSLELVDTDNKHKNRKKKNSSNKSKGVFDLIPSNHKSVTTVGRGGKIEKRSIYNIGDGKSKKQAIVKDPKVRIEENVKKLNALAASNLKEDITEKILKRARSGKALIEIVKEKEEEGTVFTEEDFKNFEKDLTY